MTHVIIFIFSSKSFVSFARLILMHYIHIIILNDKSWQVCYSCRVDMMAWALRGIPGVKDLILQCDSEITLL